MPLLIILGHNSKTVYTLSKTSSIIFLILQIVNIFVGLNYYDDSSLFGMFRSEIGEMSVHPAAIFAIVITIITIYIEVSKFKANNPDEIDKN